jgi:hypothetical protein
MMVSPCIKALFAAANGSEIRLFHQKNKQVKKKKATQRRRVREDSQRKLQGRI